MEEEPGPRFMNFERLRASPNTNPSPQGFGKSPLGRIKLTLKKGVVFSLEAMLETSLVQVRGEGTSLEPVQAGLGLPTKARAELVSGVTQMDLATPFPIGAKTRPMTMSANK